MCLYSIFFIFFFDCSLFIIKTKINDEKAKQHPRNKQRNTHDKSASGQETGIMLTAISKCDDARSPSRWWWMQVARGSGQSTEFWARCRGAETDEGIERERPNGLILASLASDWRQRRHMPSFLSLSLSPPSPLSFSIPATLVMKYEQATVCALLSLPSFTFAIGSQGERGRLTAVATRKTFPKRTCWNRNLKLLAGCVWPDDISGFPKVIISNSFRNVEPFLNFDRLPNVCTDDDDDDFLWCLFFWQVVIIIESPCACCRRHGFLCFVWLDHVTTSYRYFRAASAP